MKKYRIISFSFSLFFEKNYIIKYNIYYNNIDFRGIIKNNYIIVILCSIS